ncbi:8626_t:CDS:2 [Diversispora eburnea]|uniref:8626_t:CDS:1 n=2 Tax=Diversisporales TaxID=214509 RepID=A0A9N9CW23_9GLOM|nr:8626_t:CDS:2 [Diversispora eburnea]
MVPCFLPPVVQNKCDEYVGTFIDPPQKLLHDGTWKELDNALVDITGGILGTKIGQSLKKDFTLRQYTTNYYYNTKNELHSI